MQMMKRLAFAALMVGLSSTASAQDYRLSLEGMGMRDYYCQITVALENMTPAPLTEISGYFYSYDDGAQKGRSKGSWFMGVAPGAQAEAVFETPNAPCHDGVRFEFVVGACRIGSAFEDKAGCAARMAGEGPIRIAAPTPTD